MKIMINKPIGFLMAMALCAPAFGQESSLKQLKSLAGDAAVESSQETPAVTAAPVPTTLDKNYPYKQDYQGTLDMKDGSKIEVCYESVLEWGFYDDQWNRVSTGFYDPDVPGMAGVIPGGATYSSEPVSQFTENGKKCASSLIAKKSPVAASLRTCSGLSMAGGTLGGDVMSGSKKVGTYKTFKRVDSCPAAVPQAACSISAKLDDSELGTLTLKSEAQDAGTLYSFLWPGNGDVKFIVRGDNDLIRTAEGTYVDDTLAKIVDGYRTGAEAVSLNHEYADQKRHLIFKEEPGSNCSTSDAALIMFWMNMTF
jgi:hypothetical protein